MQKNGIIFKNKDSEEIPCCHFCNSRDVIKFGHQMNKVQRYQCNTCHKTFNERYGTLFYKKHLSDDQILQIVYLFLTGYSIGKMPPMFEVTDYNIRRILREVLLQFQKFKKYLKANCSGETRAKIGHPINLELVYKGLFDFS